MWNEQFTIKGLFTIVTDRSWRTCDGYSMLHMIAQPDIQKITTEFSINDTSRAR